MSQPALFSLEFWETCAHTMWMSFPLCFLTYSNYLQLQFYTRFPHSPFVRHSSPLPFSLSVYVSLPSCFFIFTHPPFFEVMSGVSMACSSLCVCICVLNRKIDIWLVKVIYSTTLLIHMGCVTMATSLAPSLLVILVISGWIPLCIVISLSRSLSSCLCPAV